MTDIPVLVKRLRVAKMDWRMDLFGEAADALERLVENNGILQDAIREQLEARCANDKEAEVALAARDAEIDRLTTDIERTADRNRLFEENERLRQEVENLKALLPYHEYTGQDR